VTITIALVEGLQDVFRDALGLDPGEDVTKLEYGKHQRWDSVAHMALVAELEDRYGVMLDTDDVVDMSSYGKAEEILARYGAEG